MVAFSMLHSINNVSTNMISGDWHHCVTFILTDCLLNVLVCLHNYVLSVN